MHASRPAARRLRPRLFPCHRQRVEHAQLPLKWRELGRCWEGLRRGPGCASTFPPADHLQQRRPQTEPAHAAHLPLPTELGARRHHHAALVAVQAPPELLAHHGGAHLRRRVGDEGLVGGEHGELGAQARGVAQQAAALIHVLRRLVESRKQPPRSRLEIPGAHEQVRHRVVNPRRHAYRQATPNVQRRLALQERAHAPAVVLAQQPQVLAEVVAPRRPAAPALRGEPEQRVQHHQLQLRRVLERRQHDVLRGLERGLLEHAREVGQRKHLGQQRRRAFQVDPDQARQRVHQRHDKRPLDTRIQQQKLIHRALRRRGARLYAVQALLQVGKDPTATGRLPRADHLPVIPRDFAQKQPRFKVARQGKQPAAEPL
ncbi:uncharacterized protein BcabD6B2_56450 [Babesia caballi]|uniref:Uncharacterized protein n=1 Tax=Babesia caballi TaxID=5871 RepID=A0AAV4M5V0_BABCB|nr:hypothetical protein BcabD6B2_56450 [Babesia caballi]